MIATQEYVFGGKTHIPPTATVTDGEPVEDAPLYGFNESTLDISAPIGTVEEVADVFIFTADDVTEATYDYYKNWYCDYRVTFESAMEAESFGLYGKYSGYEVAFTSPIDVTAGQSMNLVESLLGMKMHYSEIKDLVSPFDCGAFNLSDENVGKKMTVELILWNPNIENSELVIATQEYVFGEKTSVTCQVTLTSQDTQGNSLVATLEGGGEKTIGSSVTVTAPSLTGKNFIGWFVDKYEGEPVSTSLVYTFTVSANTDLVAVYENAGTGILHVKGQDYYVNDSVLQDGNNDFDFPIGTPVTLVYTGDDFLYWVNISGNIVSTSETYNFVLVGETTIRLITKINHEEERSIYVYFMNAYKQVLENKRCKDIEEIEGTFPKTNPTKTGAVFVKWVFDGTTDEATVDAIWEKASVDNVVVKIVPLYDTTDAGSYILKVQYKNGGDPIDIEDMTFEIEGGSGKKIKLSDVAEAAGLSADSFSFWSFDGVTAVSYDKTSYTVVGLKDQEITVIAVFGETTEAEPTVKILDMWGVEWIDNGTTKYKISTKMSWFVPDDCTVQKNGFVYTTNQSLGTNELLLLDTQNSNIKVQASGSISTSGIYTFNGNVGTNTTKVLYIRAFLQYTDINGGVHTLYTDVQSGSYSSLHH